MEEEEPKERNRQAKPKKKQGKDSITGAKERGSFEKEAVFNMLSAEERLYWVE